MAKSRYEELLNMAHSATNGAGAAFSRDEQGNTYVDTYTGNGQERQQVAFTPDKPVEERHSNYEELSTWRIMPRAARVLPSPVTSRATCM